MEIEDGNTRYVQLGANPRKQKNIWAWFFGFFSTIILGVFIVFLIVENKSDDKGSDPPSQQQLHGEAIAAKTKWLEEHKAEVAQYTPEDSSPPLLMGESSYTSSGHNGLGLLQHEIPEQCVENGKEEAVAKCGDCEDLSLCMFVADMSYLIMEETRSYISSPSTDMIFGSSGYATGYPIHAENTTVNEDGDFCVKTADTGDLICGWLQGRYTWNMKKVGDPESTVPLDPTKIGKPDASGTTCDTVQVTKYRCKQENMFLCSGGCDHIDIELKYCEAYTEDEQNCHPSSGCVTKTRCQLAPNSGYSYITCSDYDVPYLCHNACENYEECYGTRAPTKPPTEPVRVRPCISSEIVDSDKNPICDGDQVAMISTIFEGQNFALKVVDANAEENARIERYKNGAKLNSWWNDLCVPYCSQTAEEEANNVDWFKKQDDWDTIYSKCDCTHMRPYCCSKCPDSYIYHPKNYELANLVLSSDGTESTFYVEFVDSDWGLLSTDAIFRLKSKDRNCYVKIACDPRNDQSCLIPTAPPDFSPNAGLANDRGNQPIMTCAHLPEPTDDDYEKKLQLFNFQYEVRQELVWIAGQDGTHVAKSWWEREMLQPVSPVGDWLLPLWDSFQSQYGDWATLEIGKFLAYPINMQDISRFVNRDINAKMWVGLGQQERDLFDINVPLYTPIEDFNMPEEDMEKYHDLANLNIAYSLKSKDQDAGCSYSEESVSNKIGDIWKSDWGTQERTKISERVLFDNFPEWKTYRDSAGSYLESLIFFVETPFFPSFIFQNIPRKDSRKNAITHLYIVAQYLSSHVDNAVTLSSRFTANGNYTKCIEARSEVGYCMFDRFVHSVTKQTFLGQAVFAPFETMDNDDLSTETLAEILEKIYDHAKEGSEEEEEENKEKMVMMLEKFAKVNNGFGRLAESMKEIASDWGREPTNAEFAQYINEQFPTSFSGISMEKLEASVAVVKVAVSTLIIINLAEGGDLADLSFEEKFAFAVNVLELLEGSMDLVTISSNALLEFSPKLASEVEELSEVLIGSAVDIAEVVGIDAGTSVAVAADALRMAKSIGPMFSKTVEVVGTVGALVAIGFQIYDGVEALERGDKLTFAIDTIEATAGAMALGVAILAGSATTGPGIVAGIGAFSVCLVLTILQETIFKPVTGVEKMCDVLAELGITN